MLGGCAFVVALNCGGTVRLALNLAFLFAIYLLVRFLARPGLEVSDGRSLVVFGPRGFAGVCIYLGLLYTASYFYLRPEGRPSMGVQLFTLGLYAIPITGLVWLRPRSPMAQGEFSVGQEEPKRILSVFLGAIGGGFLLSIPMARPLLGIPAAASLLLWTPLGFGLTAWAMVWPGGSICPGRNRLLPAVTPRRWFNFQARKGQAPASRRQIMTKGRAVRPLPLVPARFVF